MELLEGICHQGKRFREYGGNIQAKNEITTTACTDSSIITEFIKRSQKEYSKCEAFLNRKNLIFVWFKEPKQIPKELKGRNVERSQFILGIELSKI